MFGINGGEFLIILVVIGLVVGPQRLPEYAEQLGKLIKQGRDLLSGARTRVESEFAEQGVGLDLADLDPRKYDPRKIVRDALMEPSGGEGSPRGVGSTPAAMGAGAMTGAGAFTGGTMPYPQRLASDQSAPFDSEAT